MGPKIYIASHLPNNAQYRTYPSYFQILKCILISCSYVNFFLSYHAKTHTHTHACTHTHTHTHKHTHTHTHTHTLIKVKRFNRSMCFLSNYEHLKFLQSSNKHAESGIETTFDSKNCYKFTFQLI